MEPTPVLAQGSLARPPAASFPLARVLTATAARAAAPIAIPLYLGVFLGASVLFNGPNALRAATVTRAAEASPAIALGLLAAWVLLTFPLARAVVDLPSTFLLRALPVHRARFVAITGLHLATLSLPWGGLWARGAGLLAGAAALAVAAGAHGLWLARPFDARRPAEIAAALAVLAAAVRPGALTLPLAAAGAAVGVHAAWLRAPERSSRSRGVRLPSSPPAALAVALLLAARRAEPGLILRGALLAALGGLVTPLAARGYDLDAPSAQSALSLGIAAGTLAVAGAGVAAATLRAEQAHAWMLDSVGAGGGLRVVAATAATAAAGVALGLAHGALVARGLDAGPALAARIVGVSGAWGAVIAALAGWHARRAHIAGPRRDRWGPVRLIVLSALAITAVAYLGELAVPLVALLASALAAISAPGAAALPPPRCARAPSGTKGARR